MQVFRLLLVAMIVAILVYTAVVIANHGMNLVPVFLCFLLLSGLWTVWRNGFTPKAWALGAVAVFFGIMFLAAYLLYLSYQHKGDVKSMLIGECYA